MRFAAKAIARAIVIGLMASGIAAGQSGTGAIAGIVRDASGGAVPGALVVATNERSAIAIETVTMDNAESANEYGNSGSYMDAYHRELDWARSASDVPDHFVMSVLYEVPSRVRNRFVSALRSGMAHRDRRASVRTAVHGRDEREHDQRVPGRAAAAQSHRRPDAPRRRAHD